MDTNTLLIIIGVIVVCFVGLAIYINKRLSELSKPDDNQSILMMNQNLQGMQERLDKTTDAIRDQFKSSASIIKDVTEKLTKLEDTNTQIIGIADQLQGLEHVLRNPKQRGILGEYYLETALKNFFSPQQYKIQYAFKNGQIADAALFIKDKILCIDSKFSLETYNKILQEKNEVRKKELERSFKTDLKNRIDETSKYIKPSEDTMDFAFMFIPSEGLFYDLLNNKVGTLEINTQDLMDYAFSKKVIIVSPTTFGAYLQTVLQGLRALEVEKSIKEVVGNVNSLIRHLNSYEEYFKKVGNNLGTTVNMYNTACKEFGKIDKDVTKITGKSLEAELVQLDKPSSD